MSDSVRAWGIWIIFGMLVIAIAGFSHAYIGHGSTINRQRELEKLYSAECMVQTQCANELRGDVSEVYGRDVCLKHLNSDYLEKYSVQYRKINEHVPFTAVWVNNDLDRCRIPNYPGN